MKFRVTFKTPDALDDAINSEVEAERDRRVSEVDEERDEDSPSEEEEVAAEEALDEDMENLEAEMRECAEAFISSGEYITVEFDTKTGKATVIEDD